MASRYTHNKDGKPVASPARATKKLFCSNAKFKETTLWIATKKLYRAGLLLHGHKCPAMPMGLRAGLAALEALDVPRPADGQLTALIEIDSGHCATCYADGIQMATGCTFGKGNIRKLGYGKFVLILVEVKTGRSVRVATRNEVIKRNQEGGWWCASTSVPKLGGVPGG
jgi:formylmethanofuran dehydrogenase subunit E